MGRDDPHVRVYTRSTLMMIIWQIREACFRTDREVHHEAPSITRCC
jgi:hypothetical protein